MKLFKLTLITLFRRKSWAVCAFLVLLMPFVLPQLSSGTENPGLLKPALAQAAWGMAWLSAAFWGFFAAAKTGENLSRSGLGEYFQTMGVSATRQLLEIWAALMVYIAPLGIGAALVCIFAASPSLPDERAMWIATNFQYALLFTIVVAPLIALAVATASRFGSLTGFIVSTGITFYGLYGVGYMKLLLTLEGNPLLSWLWSASPHYHFADPTERLRYKLGAIEWSQFPLLIAYFLGIFLLYTAFSRLIFRVKATA
ncbi:hypothetical protein HAHE_30340 [Haloferula helveola]|uniref:ABC-2 type transport system permease protein n=1 Tax=Haloferula helveola TaxID=490095 RepID=A0ABM7RBV4_9BACT|nr:hypothetical protein HAHE_30340 [Haloferula helveola]